MNDQSIITAESPASLIHSLTNELKACIGRVQETSKDALIIGHQLGTALDDAGETLEQPEFDIILEQCGLNREQAKKLKHFSRSCTIAQINEGNQSILRQGMFDLGCVPIAIKAGHEGDKTVTLGKSHNSWLNPWHQFMTGVKAGSIVVNDERLRRDTKEVYQWLIGVHGAGKTVDARG